MQKTTQATGSLHSSTCIFFDKDPRDESLPTEYGITHFYAIGALVNILLETLRITIYSLL
jgi:hypothetical protein